MPARRARLHHAKAGGVRGSSSRLPSRVCRWRDGAVCGSRPEDGARQALTLTDVVVQLIYRGRYRGHSLRRCNFCNRQ